MSSGGGAERALTHLANYYATQGYDCVYLSLCDRGYYEINETIRRDIIEVKVGMLSVARQIVAIRRYLNQNKFDCVIVYKNNPDTACAVSGCRQQNPHGSTRTFHSFGIRFSDISGTLLAYNASFQHQTLSVDVACPKDMSYTVYWINKSFCSWQIWG